MPVEYISCFPVLVKPLDVAEVLTMREQIVLWEHTDASLVCACDVSFNLALESIDVAFLLYHLKWSDLVY